MLNVRKLNADTGRRQEMHMIRHHYPRRQSITFATVEEQRVLHHRRHPLVFQITSAVALIEICFNASTQHRFDIKAHLFLKLYSPSLKHRLR